MVRGLCHGWLRFLTMLGIAAAILAVLAFVSAATAKRLLTLIPSSVPPMK